MGSKLKSWGMVIDSQDVYSRPQRHEFRYQVLTSKTPFNF